MYFFRNFLYSFLIVSLDVRQVHSKVERNVRSATYRHKNEAYLESKK